MTRREGRASGRSEGDELVEGRGGRVAEVGLAVGKLRLGENVNYEMGSRRRGKKGWVEK